MLFSSKAVASASKVAARGFHASAKAEARKFFVGGKYIFYFLLAPCSSFLQKKFFLVEVCLLNNNFLTFLQLPD